MGSNTNASENVSVMMPTKRLLLSYDAQECTRNLLQINYDFWNPKQLKTLPKNLDCSRIARTDYEYK